MDNCPLIELIHAAGQIVNRIAEYPPGAIHCMATFYSNHAAMRCLQAVEQGAEHCGRCQ